MKMMKEGYQLQHPEYEYLNMCRHVFGNMEIKKETAQEQVRYLFLVIK